MFLTRLTAENFGLHEKISVEFAHGINGILGPNGSGKSTLVRALRFALVDTTEIGSKQSDQIRLNSNGPSLVRLEGVHNEQPFTVCRRLRPGGQRLDLPSGSYASDADIRLHLEAFLGVRYDYLDDHVLIGQKQIARFLHLRDAERVSLFVRLFGINRMERIYDGLGEVVSGIHCPDYTSEIDENEKALLLLRTELTNLYQEAQSIHQLLQDPVVTEAPVVLERYQSNARALQRCEELRRRRDGLSSVEVDVSAKQSLLDAVQQYQQQVRLLASQIYQLQIRDEKRRHVLLFQTQLEATRRSLQTLTPPVPPEGYLGLDERSNYALHDELSRLRSLLQATSGSTTRCPLCASDLSHLHEHRPQYQEQLRRCEQTYQEFQARVAASQQHDRRVEHYQREVHGLQAEQARLQQMIQSSVIPTLEGEVEVLQAQEKEAYRQLSLAHKKLGDLTTLAEQAAQQRFQREEIDKTLMQLQQHVQEHFVGEEEYAAAVQTNQLAGQARVRFDFLQGAVHARQQQLQSMEATLQRLRSKQTQSDRIRRRLSILQRTRAVFHRSAAPRDVMTSQQKRLQEEMNRVLAHCQVPFQTVLTEDLRFRVRYMDGREHDARWLSGGQEVVFALAFHLAIHKLFARQIGCLVLDEPTAGLDQDNLYVVETSLDYLRRNVHADRLQILLVTHEPRLERLFDRVIRLGTTS